MPAQVKVIWIEMQKDWVPPSSSFATNLIHNLLI